MKYLVFTGSKACWLAEQWQYLLLQLSDAGENRGLYWRRRQLSVISATVNQ